MTDLNGRQDQFIQALYLQGVHSPHFVNAPAEMYETLGRNVLRGPNFKNADLSLSRSFALKFRESAKLAFRSEFFNVVHRVNLGLPDNTVGHRTFGRITSVGGGPRILQFSLKAEF